MLISGKEYGLDCKLEKPCVVSPPESNDNWEIERSRFTQEKDILGKGEFGEVRRGESQIFFSCCRRRKVIILLLASLSLPERITSLLISS